MEIVWIGIAVATVCMLLYFGFDAWLAKRRKAAHDAEILAASAAASKRKMVESLPASQGPWVGSSRGSLGRSSASSSFTPQQPQTVVVNRDDGFNPLLAGAIGYMIGSSGNGHAHATASSLSESCKPEPEAPTTWHGSDDSSSSSSSYDSGSSSSDSGSSDSGGGSSSD